MALTAVLFANAGCGQECDGEKFRASNAECDAKSELSVVEFNSCKYFAFTEAGCEPPCLVECYHECRSKSSYALCQDGCATKCAP
jgi:hypothetical protein